MYSEQLDRLHRLYEEGALSDEELAEAKLIVERNAAESVATETGPETIYGLTANTWCMLMHLSQYCAYLSFGMGIVVPITMWMMSKDRSQDADNHGRAIMNWLFSDVIYLLISCILIIAIIGIPMLIISLLLGLIYPIIGAMRASRGTLWIYPHSITFFTIYESAEDVVEYDDDEEDVEIIEDFEDDDDIDDPFGDRARGY